MKKTNLILIVTGLITLGSCKENTNSNESKSQTKQATENFDEILSKYKTDIPTKILTPNHVDSRIDELEFYDGIPTDTTLEKVYENAGFSQIEDQKKLKIQIYNT